MHRLRCEACGGQTKELRWEHEHATWACKVCGGHQIEDDPSPSLAPGVIGDECDVTIHHGICHPDGTPKRYTSKSAMRDAARALGLTNAVRHVPSRGSDKSPHTSRWV